MTGGSHWSGRPVSQRAGKGTHDRTPHDFGSLPIDQIISNHNARRPALTLIPSVTSQVLHCWPAGSSSSPYGPAPATTTWRSKSRIAVTCAFVPPAKRNSGSCYFAVGVGQDRRFPRDIYGRLGSALVTSSEQWNDERLAAIWSLSILQARGSKCTHVRSLASPRTIPRPPGGLAVARRLRTWAQDNNLYAVAKKTIHPSEQNYSPR
jgi:hypothetical protein